MEEWLIRTAQNTFIGPLSKDELRERIQRGELSLQDEVCSGTGYWIYLHETDEIRQQLGVTPPKELFQPGEEVTETDTTLTATNRIDETSLPEILVDDIDDVDQTTFLQNRALREFTPLQNQEKKDSEPIRPEVVQSPRVEEDILSKITTNIEKPTFWKGIAWILISIAALLIATVIKITREL